MKLFQDFKEFAVRGNVVDMGIGVMIGTAFSKIVDSLVTDILMPPVGLLLGQIDFSNLYINLSGGTYQSLAEAKEHGAITLNIGTFFNTVTHFTIVAFATFLTVHQINRIRNVPMENMMKKPCPYCLMDIPRKAKRCPQCTSNLTEDTEKNRALKVNIK